MESCDGLGMEGMTCKRCGGSGVEMSELDNRVIGSVMRKRRTMLGLSMDAVGKQMGVTRQYIHMLETERGRQVIRWTDAKRQRYEAALDSALRTKAARQEKMAKEGVP